MQQMTQAITATRESCFKDKGRLAGSIVYLILGMLILAACLIWWRNQVFYDTARTGFQNTWRVTWCLAFAFFGFSA